MKTIVRDLFPFLTIFPFSKSSATWSQPNSKEQENKQTNKMTTNIRWTPFQAIRYKGYLSNWHAVVPYKKKKKNYIENVEEKPVFGRGLWWQMRSRYVIW